MARVAGGDLEFYLKDLEFYLRQPPPVLHHASALNAPRGGRLWSARAAGRAGGQAGARARGLVDGRARGRTGGRASVLAASQPELNSSVFGQISNVRKVSHLSDSDRCEMLPYIWNFG